MGEGGAGDGVQGVWDRDRDGDIGAKPRFSLQFLSQCLQVALATRLGKDYSPEVHSAVDKFMSAVASVLAEKYR